MQGDIMKGKKLADQVMKERAAKKKTIKSGRAPLPSRELTKERRKTSKMAKDVLGGH